MKDTFRGLGIGVGVLAVVFVLGLFGWGLNAFFAPRAAAVQNSVFHNSQQYTDGMIDQLSQYEVQYDGGNASQRAAIASVVREQYASFPEDRLNPDLRNFLDKMKGYTP